MALARASGSRRGTTLPVSPTIRAESPTSVTAQGTPQAMDSPTTLGNDSPADEEVDAGPATEDQAASRGERRERARA